MSRRQAAGRHDDEPEIGPDELDAVRLFLRLDTQWRVQPMSGVRTGLEYAAVPAVAAMMEITVTPGLFDDLRAMEGAALAVIQAA